jgi:hypothetical protein
MCKRRSWCYQEPLSALLITLAVAGCAHRGAVRVQCDGPLRPINAPTQSLAPPVSIGPKTPTNTSPNTPVLPDDGALFP